MVWESGKEVEAERLKWDKGMREGGKELKEDEREVMGCGDGDERVWDDEEKERRSCGGVEEYDMGEWERGRRREIGVR